MVLVTERGGRCEEERGENHQRDEGEAEEEEGVRGCFAPVEESNALADGEAVVGAAGGAERFRWEGRHGGERG